MKLTTHLGLPVALALGLLLAACGNNTPTAPATNAPAPAADAAVDADKAAAEAKAAEEAAAAAAKAEEEKKAAEAAAKAAEEAAAAEKAAAEAKAAEEAAAAAAKAEEEKKAAEAAAAAKAAEEAAAAEKAAAAAKAEEEKKAAEAAAAAKAAEEAAAAATAPTTEAAATGVLPSAGLKPDTILAAKANTSAIGYLGVWAADAAACATVDQAGATGYVVITSLSIRQGSEMIIVNAAPLANGKATLTAGDKTVEIVQSAPDQISVGGAALVRCTAQ